MKLRKKLPFNKFFLLGLFISLFQGCSTNPKPEIEGGLTDFADLVENPEKFQDQEVVLEGIIYYDLGVIRFYHTRGVDGEFRYIRVLPEKIIPADLGFDSHRVILKGKIKWVDCADPQVVINFCGTFLKDYNILWIK